MTDGHGTDPLLRVQSLETLRTRKELPIGATGQETSRKGVCEQAGAAQGGEGTRQTRTENGCWEGREYPGRREGPEK